MMFELFVDAKIGKRFADVGENNYFCYEIFHFITQKVFLYLFISYVFLKKHNLPSNSLYIVECSKKNKYICNKYQH